MISRKRWTSPSRDRTAGSLTTLEPRTDWSILLTKAATENNEMVGLITSKRGYICLKGYNWPRNTVGGRVEKVSNNKVMKDKMIMK